MADDDERLTDWGASRRTYYGGDTADLEIGQKDEDAVAEEALARVQQREALEALAEDDFALDGDDDDDNGETRDSSAAHARAIAAKPRKSEDSQDFELVGVQTAEERAEANRQRAEQEGNVLEVDDDSSAVAAPPSQPGLSAVQQARKSAWSSRFDHTEDVPPDVRRAREAYDTADYNIFVNTGRHMTAEEHASLTELDIAFARPHEASAEALERVAQARRAARSAKVVGKGEDSEVIEID